MDLKLVLKPGLAGYALAWILVQDSVELSEGVALVLAWDCSFDPAFP